MRKKTVTRNDGPIFRTIINFLFNAKVVEGMTIIEAITINKLEDGQMRIEIETGSIYYERLVELISSKTSNTVGSILSNIMTDENVCKILNDEWCKKKLLTELSKVNMDGCKLSDIVTLTDINAK